VLIDHRELRGDLEDDDDGKVALIAIPGENKGIARVVTLKWGRCENPERSVRDVNANTGWGSL